MLKTLQMTKLEHMILHLKSITIRNNYTHKLLNLHHKNNLCLLNRKTQTTRINLHIKNIVHIVTEQITPSLLVSKNNKMMKTNEMHMLYQNLLKNHLYSTSVLLLMIEQNIMIIDIEVEVPHVSTLTTNTIHKIDTVLHLEDRFSYDKSTTPPQYSRSRYDTYKRDSRSYRSPDRSSYRSLYRHNSRPRYRSRAYSRDNNFSKYTNSYRPPSKPRSSRFSGSLSHSNPRNRINMVQPQDQSDPIKFEVHMYHPTAMANAVTPTSWFYTLYVHTPTSKVQRDNPSRLESAFLLDSGASISVLNYPTYITLTKLLDIRSNHTSDFGPHNTSKPLTVANQTEVPILHYANIISNTNIDDNSRYFSVPFAVADIKYIILGTPFFEDNIRNVNIQDFTLEFKYQSKTHPNYAKFTTLLSKDYSYFSYIYRIISKTLKYA